MSINTNIILPSTVTQTQKTDAAAPIPVINTASNASNPTYGGVYEISGSSLRQNFITRLKNVAFRTDNEKGESSGGASYIQPLYDQIDPSRQDPYACGGYKIFYDAYGISGKNCVVNQDEY